MDICEACVAEERLFSAASARFRYWLACRLTRAVRPILVRYGTWLVTSGSWVEDSPRRSDELDVGGTRRPSHQESVSARLLLRRPRSQVSSRRRRHSVVGPHWRIRVSEVPLRVDLVETCSLVQDRVRCRHRSSASGGPQTGRNHGYGGLMPQFSVNLRCPRLFRISVVKGRLLPPFPGRFAQRWRRGQTSITNTKACLAASRLCGFASAEDSPASAFVSTAIRSASVLVGTSRTHMNRTESTLNMGPSELNAC